MTERFEPVLDYPPDGMWDRWRRDRWRSYVARTMADETASDEWKAKVKWADESGWRWTGLGGRCEDG